MRTILAAAIALTCLAAEKTYECRRANRPLSIDGKLDDAAWQRAPWTDDFVDIEGDKKPTPALPHAGQDALGRRVSSTSPPRWRSRTSGPR